VKGINWRVPVLSQMASFDRNVCVAESTVRKSQPGLDLERPWSGSRKLPIVLHELRFS
jgi:hypothetical protein